MKKNIFSLGLVIMLAVNVFIAQNCMAIDYYVSAGGSDNNSGQSESDPWQTLSKVEVHDSTIGFNAGDKILFKRGDTWTNQTMIITSSGAEENPIKISDYSFGDLPIINAGPTDISDLKEYGICIQGSHVLISDLKLTGGFHVKSYPLGADFICTNCYFMYYCPSGGSDCRDPQHQYYPQTCPSCGHQSTMVDYDDFEKGSSGATGLLLIDGPQTHDITISDLIIQDSALRGISVDNATDVLINNCNVTYSNDYPDAFHMTDRRSAIYLTNGSDQITIRGCNLTHCGLTGVHSQPATNVSIENCYFANNGCSGVESWLTGNITIERSVFKDNGNYRWAPYANCQAIDAGWSGQLTIRYNDVSGQKKAFAGTAEKICNTCGQLIYSTGATTCPNCSGNDLSNYTMYICTFEVPGGGDTWPECSWQIGVRAGENLPQNCPMCGEPTSQHYQEQTHTYWEACGIYFEGGCNDAKVYGNFVYDNDGCGFSMQDGTNFDVFNNVLFNNSVWKGQNPGGTGECGSLKPVGNDNPEILARFTNNLVLNDAANYEVCVRTNDNFNFRNNIYYNSNHPDSSGRFRFLGVPMNFNTWTNNADDTDSSWIDPQLIDPTNDDFRPKANSPTIGGGYNLTSIVGSEHTSLLNPAMQLQDFADLWTTLANPLMDQNEFCAWEIGPYVDDCDGIPVDGDNNGIVGDNPCTGGQTSNCDDNCFDVSNPDQHDGYDLDGVGHDCDNCQDDPNGPQLGTCVVTNGELVYSIASPDNCSEDIECELPSTNCQKEQGDWNNNGIGDACDCIANLNGDKNVNIADLTIMKQQFFWEGCDPTDPANCCEADIDGSGKVDMADLTIMKLQFFKGPCDDTIPPPCTFP